MVLSHHSREHVDTIFTITELWSKVSNSSAMHLHYAHAARTATSTHCTGRPHQPDSQVQQTHALIITDSNATQRFSKFHYHIHLGHFSALM
jgi:hypothetical protein